MIPWVHLTRKLLLLAQEPRSLEHCQGPLGGDLTWRPEKSSETFSWTFDYWFLSMGSFTWVSQFLQPLNFSFIFLSHKVARSPQCPLLIFFPLPQSKFGPCIAKSMDTGAGHLPQCNSAHLMCDFCNCSVPPFLHLSSRGNNDAHFIAYVLLCVRCCPVTLDSDCFWFLCLCL